MALKYNVQLNNGVEAFGTGKSITAGNDPGNGNGGNQGDPNGGND